jgi:hypothetical protein
MPPIYDDYGDENNYAIEFAPTTIVAMVSINSFMHVAHDRDALFFLFFLRGNTRPLLLHNNQVPG